MVLVLVERWFCCLLSLKCFFLLYISFYMLCEFEFECPSPREQRRLGQLHGGGSSALYRLAAKIFFTSMEFQGFSEAFLEKYFIVITAVRVCEWSCASAATYKSVSLLSWPFFQIILVLNHCDKIWLMWLIKMNPKRTGQRKCISAPMFTLVIESQPWLNEDEASPLAQVAAVSFNSGSSPLSFSCSQLSKKIRRKSLGLTDPKL